MARRGRNVQPLLPSQVVIAACTPTTGTVRKGQRHSSLRSGEAEHGLSLTNKAGFMHLRKSAPADQILLRTTRLRQPYSVAALTRIGWPR